MQTRLFIRTTEAGNQILPNQTYTTNSGSSYNLDPTGTRIAVAPEGKTLLNTYDKGTFFCILESIYNQSQGRLTVNKIVPVGLSTYKSSIRPSADDEKAFQEYILANPVSDTDPGKKSEEETAAPAARKGTVLDFIKKNFPCPNVKDNTFYVEPSKWERLVRNTKMRHYPTLLYGPPGTGKTELILLLGKVLGVPVRVFDMGSMHDPMSQILGTQTLVGGPTGSVTKWRKSRFAEEIQKPGIILLDELSRAPSGTNNLLLPVLDKRRYLLCEQAEDPADRFVPVHPECMFLATANLDPECNGTEPLDEALANRFEYMQLDYLPSNKEEEILQGATHISASDAKIIVSVCAKARAKKAEGKLSRALSVRDSLAAAAYVEDGWTPTAAMDIAFLDKFDGVGGASSERATMKTLIMSR